MNRDPLNDHAWMLISGMEPFCSQALDALVDSGEAAVPVLCGLFMDGKGAPNERVKVALKLIGADVIASALPNLGCVEKISALRILGDLGRQCATHAVIKELGCDIAEVRSAAAVALRQLQDRRGLSALERAVRDPDAEVRMSAIDAIGKLGSRESVPLLIAATLDGYSKVRLAAVAALAALNDPSTGDALCAALFDQDAQVRARAALGVGKLERVDATPRLLAIAAQDHAATRDAAIVALGRCGDATAIGPLCTLLGQDEATHLSTCNALAGQAARYPDPQLRVALPELRRLSRSWPSAPVRVRSAAARARDVIESVTARVRSLPSPAQTAADRVEGLLIPDAADAAP